MPRAKVLCKYPGCAFYADPKFDYYCQDCFDKKWIHINYRQCQNPTCENYFRTTNASKFFCDSCNYGTSGAATNCPSQAGSYKEGAGDLPQKLSINSHADSNAWYPPNYYNDMPRAKVLCKYPGCSFYADPKLDYYCQDCFDKKWVRINYKRCQNPTCGNHVPTTNASKFCDSCLLSTANIH